MRNRSGVNKIASVPFGLMGGTIGLTAGVPTGLITGFFKGIKIATEQVAQAAFTVIGLGAVLLYWITNTSEQNQDSSDKMVLGITGLLLGVITSPVTVPALGIGLGVAGVSILAGGFMLGGANSLQSGFRGTFIGTQTGYNGAGLVFRKMSDCICGVNQNDETDKPDLNDEFSMLYDWWQDVKKEMPVLRSQPAE